MPAGTIDCNTAKTKSELGAIVGSCLGAAGGDDDCPDTISTDCCSNDFPASLNANVKESLGICAATDITITHDGTVWDGSGDVTYGVATCSSTETIRVQFRCSGGSTPQLQARASCDDGSSWSSWTVASSSPTCDPLDADYTVTLPGGCSIGALLITVTE